MYRSLKNKISYLSVVDHLLEAVWLTLFSRTGVVEPRLGAFRQSPEATKVMCFPPNNCFPSLGLSQKRLTCFGRFRSPVEEVPTGHFETRAPLFLAQITVFTMCELFASIAQMIGLPFRCLRNTV